jgi:hypothetical protein
MIVTLQLAKAAGRPDVGHGSNYRRPGRRAAAAHLEPDTA